MKVETDAVLVVFLKVKFLKVDCCP